MSQNVPMPPKRSDAGGSAPLAVTAAPSAKEEDPLAGLIKAVRLGEIPEGSLVTATMTGHGLKDPDTAIRVAGFEPILAKATREAVMAAVGLA